jgi:hypothetical protein
VRPPYAAVRSRPASERRVFGLTLTDQERHDLIEYLKSI